MVPLEENAEWALAFNSGLAAIMTALLTVLKPGDSIVYTVPLYGGTMGMMHNLPGAVRHPHGARAHGPQRGVG